MVCVLIIKISWRLFLLFMYHLIRLHVCTYHENFALVTCVSPNPKITFHGKIVHTFTRTGLYWKRYQTCKFTLSGAVIFDECTHIGRLSSCQSYKLNHFLYNFISLGDVIKFGFFSNLLGPCELGTCSLCDSLYWISYLVTYVYKFSLFAIALYD